MDIEEKLDDLVRLYHRAEMKHINADRMQDKYLRKEAKELDNEYEQKKEEFLKHFSAKVV